MTDIHIGIGGWNFEEWRGTFYPKGTPQAKELAYLGNHLTATEINATYYRSQSPASFAKWRDAVPDGFVFALKASRFCTNRKVLAEAGESIAKFMDQGLTELGPKLGPILWQLMATKQFDSDDMAGFLALLPKEKDGITLRHAIEPRHESFRDPAFFAMAKKAGVAIVVADADKYACFDEGASADSGADFVYARLQNSRAEIETGYDAAGLDRWASEAKGWVNDGREAFVFFISGAKVRNPAAAMSLIERLR